jgi:hypothetical protein
MFAIPTQTASTTPQQGWDAPKAPQKFKRMLKTKKQGCESNETRYVKRMDWQELSAWFIVALTAGVFAWRQWHPQSVGLKKVACCACSGRNAPSGSILFLARKGEVSQVIIKDSLSARLHRE